MVAQSHEPPSRGTPDLIIHIYICIHIQLYSTCMPAYIYTHICMFVYMYVYIYIWRIETLAILSAAHMDMGIRTCSFDVNGGL